MRISDWSSDVCSSDLHHAEVGAADLRRELAGEDMVGGRHRLLRERAQEQRLFAPRTDLAERARGADEAVVLERGLLSRRDRKGRGRGRPGLRLAERSEEHTSELQSLMSISYAVFCLR